MTRAHPVLLGAFAALALGVSFLVWSTASREAQAHGGGAQPPLPPPFLIFRTLAPADAHGRVALLSADTRREPRLVTDLTCRRVHFAGGAGVCLVQPPEDRGNAAYLFDASFTPRTRIPLDGVPTRARVAPNGRLAMVTTYAEAESPDGEHVMFHTILIDVASGRRVADLHDFRVDSASTPAIDGPIGIAGVAFAPDGDSFFATLSTPSRNYLVSGSIAERRLTTLQTDVVNEALSPDGQRLIVKRAGDDRGFWQLAIISLASGEQRDLDHRARSIDDQVEWLDDGHVLYHDVDERSTGVWSLAIDGNSSPRLLIPDAYSASVHRQGQ